MASLANPGRAATSPVFSTSLRDSLCNVCRLVKKKGHQSRSLDVPVLLDDLLNGASPTCFVPVRAGGVMSHGEINYRRFFFRVENDEVWMLACVSCVFAAAAPEHRAEGAGIWNSEFVARIAKRLADGFVSNVPKALAQREHP
jgi:hypothetical protein